MLPQLQAFPGHARAGCGPSSARVFIPAREVAAGP